MLQRVGIAVEGLVVWIFVGIEKYCGFVTRVFVACRAIWCETPNVGAYELLKVEHNY